MIWYGNRRLNRAIHIIAVTQMRMHPPAREYIARRLEEGKTSREAATKRQALHHESKSSTPSRPPT